MMIKRKYFRTELSNNTALWIVRLRNILIGNISKEISASIFKCPEKGTDCTDGAAFFLTKQVRIYQITRRHIAEGYNLNIPRLSELPIST
jgi:hypothetical protein